MAWEFHCRNCDETENWFAVCHAGCGGIIHDGRTECWHIHVDPNPKGGGGSVYAPADWVVNFKDYFKVLIDSIKVAADIGIFIASEGESLSAIKSAVMDSIQLDVDIAQAESEDGKIQKKDLQQLAAGDTLEAMAWAVKCTPGQIRSIASEMGLGSSGWAFMAGDAYQSTFHADNSYNNNSGWSILFNGDDDMDTKANHVFLKDGKMYYYGNTNTYYQNVTDYEGRADTIYEAFNNIYSAEMTDDALRDAWTNIWNDHMSVNLAMNEVIMEGLLKAFGGDNWNALRSTLRTYVDYSLVSTLWVSY